MVSSEGVKALSGYRYVSVKLNNCEGVSPAPSSHSSPPSYNLNYLEINGLEGDCHQLLEDAAGIYTANRTNFSRRNLTQSGCSCPATWGPCCW